MDLKEYDKLRKRIKIKDFEGNNKVLDKWLYGFSFVGNIGSIFFSYFLLYPSLLKAITINLIDGFWGTALAFLFANTFLIIFEIIKRYFFRNFSSDFVANNNKINLQILSWSIVSFAMIVLSFYLSLVGSKNLASTSEIKNNTMTTQVDIQKDSLAVIYENKKKTYEYDSQSLRTINNNLRQTLSETPVRYLTIRKDYQSSIDKNSKIIDNNQNEIDKIDKQLNQRIDELKSKLNSRINNNANEDSKNIVLFIIIAIFAELMIIGGVYYHEWFEHKLYIINQQKFEKIYIKKDRYRALLAYIYKEGKLNVGDKVISGLELKEVIKDSATINNKFIDEYLKEMDRLEVFVTNGKRRNIAVSYNDALNIIEHYDDTLRILENLK